MGGWRGAWAQWALPEPLKRSRACPPADMPSASRWVYENDTKNSQIDMIPEFQGWLIRI